LQHQVDKFIITKLCRIQSQAFYAGAARIKHFGSRFPPEQRHNFFTAELVFKKITIGELNLFLRKKLFRFPAGVSLYPAVKIHFFSHFDPP
jgi:hypothetical protein